MAASCAIKIMLLCSRQRRDQRALGLLKGHLLPVERRACVSLSDNQSLLAGSTVDDLVAAASTADVLVLMITPDYYGTAEFRDIVSPLAAARHEVGDGMMVGVYPFPFHTAGELDWLPTVPVYSKSTGHPRPGRPDAILADAARELLVKLSIHEPECALPRFEHGASRQVAQQLRLAYLVANLRRRDPRSVEDVDALHRELRGDGEAVPGDILDGGRFSLLYRKRHHGLLEEWAAFDQRSSVPVRAFLMPATSHSQPPIEPAVMDRLAAATAILHEADPGCLVAPLRHESGLGWFFVAEALP